MDDREKNVLISLQSALLGAVTSNLRGVGVKWDDSRIHFKCYFDGPISDKDRATMSIVEAEVLSDFPASHEVTYEVLRLDFPGWLPQDERAVYRRKEDWSSVPDDE